MRFSPLWIVVLGVVLSSCVEPEVELCGPTTCAAGCCDARGFCRIEGSRQACGIGGQTCFACMAGQACNVEGRCEFSEQVPVECRAPSRVEFGVVGLGSTNSREFIVKNDSATTQVMHVALPETSGFFTATPSGDVTVPPGVELVVTIVFHAADLGPRDFWFTLRRSDDCLARTVVVTANVVSSVVTAEPAYVNFSFAPPAATVTRTVTIKNASDSPVALRNFTTSPPFFYAGPLTATLGPRSSLEVALQFRPTELGAVTGQLVFDTDTFGQAWVGVTLFGVGGGPRISVADSLTLPLAPFPGSSTAQLEVRNVGMSFPPDSVANLRFDFPSFYVSTVGTTQLDEFFVAPLSSLDLMAGLAEGEALALNITFTPRSVGAKAIDLHLRTNDLVTPEVVVRINADGFAATACTYTVTPPSIDFGRVEFGHFIDWPLTITNTGSTPCELRNVSLSSPVTTFSLGTFTPGRLAAGDSRTVSVRYTPAAVPVTATPTGTVTVLTDSAAALQTLVPLSASAVPNCVVTPTSINFGAAQANCRSAANAIPVLNACSGPVTVSNASIVMANGEFALTSATGGTLPVSGQLAFAADYVPMNVGADAAFLTFTTTQPLGTVRHVVALRGVGTSTATVQQEFVVGNAQLDVLLVIDDSSTMGDKQASLASAVSNFWPFMTSSTIDARFGVIVTDLFDSSRAMLRRTTGNQPYVSRSTVNASMELANLVNAGVTGAGNESCLEPVNLALSESYRASPMLNAGFLRNDAHLGIVCVTDAPEQTPKPVSFELSRLSMVRDSLSYSVIGPFLPQAPAGCVYDGVNTSAHETALRQLNGVQEEICSGNVGASFGNAINHMLARGKSFTLARAVDLSATTTVSVGGQTIPPAYWTIDAMTNRLTFQSNFEPEPGRTFTVSYAPMCF